MFSGCRNILVDVDVRAGVTEEASVVVGDDDACSEGRLRRSALDVPKLLV